MSLPSREALYQHAPWQSGREKRQTVGGSCCVCHVARVLRVVKNYKKKRRLQTLSGIDGDSRTIISYNCDLLKEKERERSTWRDDHSMAIMKKRGSNENKDGKSGQNGSSATGKTTTAELSDDENQGFGNWLRSSTGVEMMRLFVIANSILVFVTMAWPNMRESFYIIKDYLVGEED
ncbi:uncharacterized protein LOC116849001 [Odontomachus brunneus]|uniref:uncharacterized protein LOC116849001 n=1 Tax=Odontomachus brunneus TaxID=486640 RepID=UPI0013F243EE|nr:uncharacterized protein LOC116849001 [Odontomachus brunneus]